ncbi:MAG: integrase domain-containing protein [Paucibacter sp.]|nr:integrase domain-containing protein [Roseateles sp.]
MQNSNKQGKKSPIRARVTRTSDLTTADFAAEPGSVNINIWQNPDHRADLRLFMRLHGYVGSNDFTRRCSEKTRTNRFVVINSVFERLQGRIRHLHRLSQFTPRYVPEILTMWREPSERSCQGMEISTQIQAFSVLSWFWKMHGIKTAQIRSYLDDPDLAKSYRRTHVATQDKSWSGNGIDVDEKIEEARAIDPVVARLLELARSFGLRANETLRIRPGIDDKLDHLHVHRGTKTGRPRAVVYDSFEGELMRQAIASVKAELGPTQHAAWEDRTLAQGRRRL